LSPFLCSGVIIDYFNLVGKTPEFRDVLIIRHKGELIKGALAFSILVEISSYPHALYISGIVYVLHYMCILACEV